MESDRARAHFWKLNRRGYSDASKGDASELDALNLDAVDIPLAGQHHHANDDEKVRDLSLS